ncbi:catechol 2,3-dioxygenase-like lactoylglutathione lyase family enzyme [Virgibacillus halotolerans]|uniref:VOC family protein n=1 Tax=Virgibacillus halotolerans TaxID=1071053 RepID=UPI001960D8BD|nr:VOC family protein [Virgibacillus halotolerans]MBM7599642.1 catechol 2,3-dioxygenase-like lactoylglutathione lyase family enzyme [Virgibacillus halotolerans]
MNQGLLHHVEINVSNLQRTIHFWGWLLEELGYIAFQKWEYGQSWKLGETYIVFVQAEQRFLDVSYHRGCIGLNHLAFHAKSAKHVDEITKKLEEKGAPILYSDRHPFAGGPEHYAVYFEDPDRIKVEVVAPSVLGANKKSGGS